MKYHFISIRMALKRWTIISLGEEVEKLEPSLALLVGMWNNVASLSFPNWKKDGAIYGNQEMRKRDNEIFYLLKMSLGHSGVMLSSA